MYGKCILASYFWSITRGSLWWEGFLNGGTTVITRGGLWWEGSLNGGTTVLLVYN